MADRILIIDDDDRLATMLATWLDGAGLVVTTRSTAETGLAAARTGAFDAVVLDVMLPDGDGFEVCRALRAGSDVPILMLTARGDDTDRITGLELGADDYLAKPFNPRELLARIRAILRRTKPAPRADLLRFGTLEIDAGGRRVHVGGQPVSLTAHQLNILLALARRPGRVLSREALMELVRGEDLDPWDRSLDVHISRIRAAIEPDPRSPQRILTLRGAGYLFAEKQP